MDRPALQHDVAAFRRAFSALSGNNHAPFPWQERLFGEFVAGRIPSALDLPTGLGKTSVMAIWLIARALAGAEARHKLPRRLIYVVDRRAVVDQATAEAEKIRSGLEHSGLDLGQLGLNQGGLPISTLRGQHADNRAWLADPTDPAIVVGTVDMVGSRLLFSGYGVSAKMRPFHAGLLGADTLVVLDEAHLVPPFEALLKAVARDRCGFGPRTDEDRTIIPPFRLLSLSATGREDISEQDEARVDKTGLSATFRLDEDDSRHPVVAKRLNAVKALTIHDAFDGNASLVNELAELAWTLGARPARVLVYCTLRTDALKVTTELKKRAKKTGVVMELLVGQRRVHERDKLSRWLDDNGFTGSSGESLPPAVPTFLVATSAGEVGVDLDAHHMVCDLVEWERMVQRLGRVNRRGGKEARVEVVALASKHDPKGEEPPEKRLERLSAPLALLPRRSDGTSDASPGAILALKADHDAVAKMRAAETAEPLRPALTRALVDAWSMTSLEKHAGRPNIQPWLRGWDEDDEPQGIVVWRECLPIRMQGDRIVQVNQAEINEFFEAAPPRLSEMLEAESRSVIAPWLFKRVAAAMAEVEKLEKAGEAGPLGKDSPVLFVLNTKDELEDVGPRTLRAIAELEGKDRDRFVARLGGRTLVVSRHLGGLTSDGLLADSENGSPVTMDSDENWDARPFRVYATNDRKSATGLGWKRSHYFVSQIGVDEDPKRWLVVDERTAGAESEESRAVSTRAQSLNDHRRAVKNISLGFAEALGLPAGYAEMLGLAGWLHDEGKDVWRWQRAFNAPRDVAYAKTKGPVNLKLLDGYRHEFGSLIRIEKNAEFGKLPLELRDLLLHLVAAHHGNARPLISAKNCEGAIADLEAHALEAALRFERLQQRWGPWGLAWWESLLRAADQQASRANDEASDIESESVGPGRAA